MKKNNQNNKAFSVIVPVYNRPDELNELLVSLTHQSNQNFEVIIVEDGSDIKSDRVVENFKNKLDIHYYYKENSGPGQSRNYGMKRANTDFFVIFDSDVVVPKDYFKNVSDFLSKHKVDAYGGADRASKDFTNLQKAIDFAMTSIMTTGGIRGKAEKFEKFHPRSFNMGMSKVVFEQTGGFSKMRFGEDIDLSIRIINNNFKTALIKTAFVYHKRRNTIKQFFKQVFNSGIARINLYKRHPQSLKMVHFFPLFFLLGLLFGLVLSFFKIYFFLVLYLIYFVAVFLLSAIKYKSLKAGILSIVTVFTMLNAYGLGFLLGIWRRIILQKDEFHRFEKNFYK